MSKIPPQLVYVKDETAGYYRVRSGKAFRYLDANQTLIQDKIILRRIQQLAIPPQWKEVWICPQWNGHIQVTGKDAKGRKQYIYHPEWISYRQANKFARLEEFGNSLPRIRRRIQSDLSEDHFSYRKTLALAVKLLDCHYLRIGNDFYLNENETYGLTTIRRKHFENAKDQLRLEYQAKSGKTRKISITNRKLVHLLREINELPGYEVFRYWEGPKSHRILSDDVNQYIKDISGQDFTAKDFRTWGGTVTAVDEYQQAKAYADQSSRRKLVTAIVRRVAKVLGNTVATARDYYIYPKVLQALTTYGPETFAMLKTTQQFQNPYLKESEMITLGIIATKLPLPSEANRKRA